MRAADVGEKTDADLGHGEGETLARDPVRGVDRDADAPAHDDAVDQRDDGFRIGADSLVELVFLAPERQLLIVVAGAPEFIETADVAAGAKGLVARAADHDPW